jgi:hypothetical protein
VRERCAPIIHAAARPTELSGLPAAGFPHFRSQEVRAPLRGFAKLRAAGRSTWRSYPLARARWSGPVASRHAVPAVRFDFLPRLAPVSASARDMVPPHTGNHILSLCNKCCSSIKAIADRGALSMHSLRPVARGGSQPHSRTERRFWISAARENSERTSRVLSLPRSRRHIAKSTVAL